MQRRASSDATKERCIPEISGERRGDAEHPTGVCSKACRNGVDVCPQLSMLNAYSLWLGSGTGREENVCETVGRHPGQRRVRAGREDMPIGIDGYNVAP